MQPVPVDMAWSQLLSNYSVPAIWEALHPWLLKINAHVDKTDTPEVARLVGDLIAHVRQELRNDQSSTEEDKSTKVCLDLARDNKFINTSYDLHICTPARACTHAHTPASWLVQPMVTPTLACTYAQAYTNCDKIKSRAVCTEQLRRQVTCAQ